MPGVSGMVTSVRGLAEGLVASGNDVSLACPDSIEARHWACRVGVDLHPLPAVTLPARISQRSVIPVPNMRKRIWPAVVGADIVHLHSPFLIRRAVVRCARERDIPIVATCHALPANVLGALRLDGARLKRTSSFLMRRICCELEAADVIVSPSKFAAQHLTNQCGRLDVRVISNGVKINTRAVPLRHGAVNRDGHVRALYVGRLQREKRVDELIRGICAAQLDGTDVCLTIVGTGPDEKRLRRITQRIPTRHVRFVGHLTDEALAETYGESTVFCMASRAELQCCAALEAMAAGLPVVAARAAALPETVADGIAGRLYDPGNVREFASIITGLAHDDSNYQSLSAGARATAQSHSLDESCTKMLALYQATMKLGQSTQEMQPT